MSRTRTVEESRWNVASKFASLVQGERRSNGVPVFDGFVDEARREALDVVANELTPV